MKVNLDGVDYQSKRNKNNELEVTLVNSVPWGKVISLPELNNAELMDVFEVYIDMYVCLYSKEVTHSDLMKLYDRYSNYDVVLVNNTLIVLYNTEIVAVLVDVTDLEFIGMDMRAKLVFYYFTLNEFKPYFIDYTELLGFANDLNW